MRINQHVLSVTSGLPSTIEGDMEEVTRTRDWLLSRYYDNHTDEQWIYASALDKLLELEVKCCCTFGPRGSYTKCRHCKMFETMWDIIDPDFIKEKERWG